MNKNYETAILSRETAAATPRLLKKFDFNVGDLVQIRTADKYNGRVGEIIGIRYIERNENGLLSYTIKLSDKDAIEVNDSQMSVVRKAEI